MVSMGFLPPGNFGNLNPQDWDSRNPPIEERRYGDDGDQDAGEYLRPNYFINIQESKHNWWGNNNN